MTDEELIKLLRSIDHMNVDDCFLQSYFYSKAADRIEQLLEGGKGLATAFAVVAVKREMTEAKLEKALDALKKAQTYITDLEEHEGAEGFSQSTGEFGREYNDSLAELEKTE